VAVLKKGTDRSVHGEALSEGEGNVDGDRVVSPLFQHGRFPPEEITMGRLLALGASGGLVPCRSALVLGVGWGADGDRDDGAVCHEMAARCGADEPVSDAALDTGGFGGGDCRSGGGDDGCGVGSGSG
jgi:hypothetical protein